MFDVNKQDLPFELAALAGAANYQRWIFRAIQQHLGTRILEIGSGIGNMSQWLPVGDRLILTENDPSLLKVLSDFAASSATLSGPKVSVRSFNLMEDDVEWLQKENLDTIVSFNVLEHVEDDEFALRRLADILRGSSTGGPRRIVTFVPAHSWAYGSIDRGFGHFRRYSKGGFRELTKRAVPDAEFSARYFNFPGLLGWFLNGRVFKAKQIGEFSIRTFERICPYISDLDDFFQRRLRFPMGQSLLVVLELKTN